MQKRKEVSSMFRWSYDDKKPDEATQALAEKVATLAIEAQMSYEHTMKALEIAQRLIVTESRPIKI